MIKILLLKETYKEMIIMVYTEKEFEQAKQNGEFGSAITYRRYLAFSEFDKKTARNRARREQQEAYNRKTSLYDVKFKN